MVGVRECKTVQFERQQHFSVHEKVKVFSLKESMRTCLKERKKHGFDLRQRKYLVGVC